MAEIYVFEALMTHFRNTIISWVLGSCLLLSVGCARIISPNRESGFQISGVVQLARVTGSTIRVYALLEDGSQGALLAETTTNSEGEYTVSVGTFSGHVLIESNGGTYTDEATGDVMTASALSAVVHSNEASNAAISPMSTLVKERLLELASTVPLASAKTMAVEEVAKVFGVVPEDVDAVPTNPVALVSSSTKATRAAMAIAAFSYLLKDFRNENNMAVGVADAMTVLADDLKDDGKVNGSLSS
ncbi:MAG: hypothetical protein EB078_12500, partial [Proteobacteria bacterium]|nr:hypothetical protein [Pseudomonadota bacterium]